MGYRARMNGKSRKIRQLEKKCNILKVRNKILEKVVIDTNNEYHTKFLKLEKMCFDTQKLNDEVLKESERVQKKISDEFTKVRDEFYTKFRFNNLITDNRYKRFYRILNKKMDEPTWSFYVVVFISALLGCVAGGFII